MKSKLSYERIKQRTKGNKRLDPIDLGFIKIGPLYVHDPIIIKWWRYLVKNHRWVLGVLIPLITAITLAIIQFNLNRPQLTSQYYYTPKTISNYQGKSINAKCQEPSSVNRNDAFKCFVGNNVYDPCFSNIEGNAVACPDTPYGKEVIYKLTRTDKPYERNNFDLRPWYIILANGSRCRFITGATSSVAGGRLDYACTKKGEYLVLPLERTDELLKIKCYNVDGQRVELCPIKEAWF